MHFFSIRNRECIKMSRPHDGQKTFFPFGNPFRLILSKGSYLSPKLLVLLKSFEQNLAENLKRLEPKDITDVLSFAWMGQAMAFLSETHANITNLITDLQFPVSDWDEKWVDIYLDNSVKLLDICVALSSKLSQLNQGHLLLQLVLHNLDCTSKLSSSEQLKQADAYLCDWKEQVSSRSAKLENSLVVMQGFEITLYAAKVKNPAKGKVLMRVLYGVMVVTIYVCSILAAALSGCSNLLMEMRISDKFLWAEAFNDLQSNMNREIRIQFSRSKVTVLKELKEVESCMERLHVLTVFAGDKQEETLEESNEEVPPSDKNAGQAEREKLQEFVSDLSTCAKMHSHGLDLLSKQVEVFFQIVLKGRNSLLCKFREPDVMEEEKGK